MASSSETIRRRIEAGKSTVKDKYAVSKVAARRLSGAHSALIEAEEMRELKNTSKSVTRCAVAENTLLSAKKEFVSFVSLYTSFVADVLSLYDELIAAEDAKGAKKARVEAEKFERRESYLKDALYDMVKDVEGISEMTFEPKRNAAYRDNTETKQEGAPSPDVQSEARENTYQAQGYQVPPQYHQPHYYQPYHDPYRPHPPVNIAPTTIDISRIVEDAVASALEKFKVVFNRRADEFVSEYPLPAPQAIAPNVSGAVAQMEGEIAANEAEIAEKLGGIVEGLTAVSKSMTELGASYMALTNAEQDAVLAQRKINEMQRTLSREIQGVQAKQKVINQDQAGISAEQAAVISEGKANIENQKLIMAEQAETVEMQKALLEAQSALDQTVKELIASQKAIIANQQAIIAASAKTAELQRELGERQAELHATQKAIMSEHKQLARKIKPKAEAKKPQEKELSDAAEEIVQNTETTVS